MVLLTPIPIRWEAYFRCTMKLLVNIGRLYGIRETPQILRGAELGVVPYLDNAWLLISGGKIESYGSMHLMPDLSAHRSDLKVDRIDVHGAMVCPAFVDCHTHLVFAASREGEFVDRIRGLSYQEIAGKGGGILNSARALASMPEEQLYSEAFDRLQTIIRSGTGAIEIKSGYGLSTEAELKMLRVIRRLRETAGVPIKATFLGAHAFPEVYANKRDAYVDLIIDEMLPEIAAQGLADYVDVFCEEGYFSADQTRRIGLRAKEFGLPLRLHANQFSSSGAIQVAAELGGMSVEHLEVMTEADYRSMEHSGLLAVSLPACSFFLGIPYTPLRTFIDRKIPFALASDFNPGSSPIYDLHFVFALACIQQRLLPEEAFNALTVNAAFALGLEQEVGAIHRGARANLNFYRIRDIAQIAYYPAARLIDRTMINGEFLHEKTSIIG